MSVSDDAHINPFGFREYDARWLYPKDINKAGIKKVGQGLGTQIVSKTNKETKKLSVKEFKKLQEDTFNYNKENK